MKTLEEVLDGVQPEIVVSVGTDFHLFDRLIDWVDDWLAAQDDRPTCFIQYGASRPPRNAIGMSRMSRSELLDLYAGAKAVIVQGGPGSILDARLVGALPIAVPRWPDRQEVVDGHQIAFAKTMELHGEVVFANSEEQLQRSLEAALQNPDLFQKNPRICDPTNAAHSLETEISNMLAEPRNSEMMKKMWSMIRSRTSNLHEGDGTAERRHETSWFRTATEKFLDNRREMRGRFES